MKSLSEQPVCPALVLKLCLTEARMSLALYLEQTAVSFKEFFLLFNFIFFSSEPHQRTKSRLEFPLMSVTFLFSIPL